MLHTSIRDLSPEVQWELSLIYSVLEKTQAKISLYWITLSVLNCSSWRSSKDHLLLLQEEILTDIYTGGFLNPSRCQCSPLFFFCLFCFVFLTNLTERCVTNCDDETISSSIVASLPNINRFVLCFIIRFLQVSNVDVLVKCLIATTITLFIVLSPIPINVVKTLFHHHYHHHELLLPLSINTTTINKYHYHH